MENAQLKLFAEQIKVLLNKSLSLTIGLLVFSLASASDFGQESPFAHANLGGCFENVETFIRQDMGEKALADTNISITTKGTWTWVVDQTTSQNYAWYLLEKKNNNKICLQVFIPAASHVEVKNSLSSTRVEAFIAPLPGLLPKLIELRPTPPSNTFYPSRCYILKGEPFMQSKSRTPISCDRVFE